MTKAGFTLDLFEEKDFVQDYSATFAGNLSRPIHKWFRYTAGFSAEWVGELLEEQVKLGRDKVIDPFAGSGTVLLECDFKGIESRGLEAHPYIHRIAKTKLNWAYSIDAIKEASDKLLKIAEVKNRSIKSVEYPKLITTCYPEPTLIRLESLKQAWNEIDVSDDEREFLWFIITSILRKSSPVGTAQWQYVLPNKTKSKVLEPFAAYKEKLQEICKDLKIVQANLANSPKSQIYREDARYGTSIPDKWGDLVITSPPYANNYDYANSTRLEMCFWGDINGWGDLQDFVRKDLIRACTQHVSNLKSTINEVLGSKELDPISGELNTVYSTLERERLNHGGKKNYHYMIACYFRDLADVFINLRRTLKKDSLMCFVIGDSAPYGVYVPVDKWLGELAINAGFDSYTFEKLRDRNVKWKNRKHTVPLQEGRLWIKG